MFEERLEEISKKLGGEKREFYILTHKKHRREIYFQNNKRAIKFIKNKLDSPFKKIIYFLIKINVLQPFLKKIKLSFGLGNVIYVANQIKAFDLDKREVTSFIKDDSNKKLFLKLKGFQKRVSKKGFAPEIFEINEKFPYSREEILQEYEGQDEIGVFSKLCSYYKLNNIKKVSLKNYVCYLETKLKETKLKNSFVRSLLKEIRTSYPKSIPLKIAKIHGSFIKEQILRKKDSYVFADWEDNMENLIVMDLAKFFRTEDLLRNKNFRKVLNLYPRDVKENIHLYLLLNEIRSIIKRGEATPFSIARIKNLKSINKK